jgi:PilZ domain-containing protein
MRRERRKNFRLEWNATAAIRGLDGHLICLCVLSNFSNGGAKLITLDARNIPDQFLLVITPGRGGTRECRVLWRSNDILGVEFTDRFSSAEKPDTGHEVVAAPALHD